VQEILHIRVNVSNRPEILLYVLNDRKLINIDDVSLGIAQKVQGIQRFSDDCYEFYTSIRQLIIFCNQGGFL
jgi:hypothetical protein